MKTKLMIFEGIPGSGKSTMAKKAADLLSANGICTRLIQEGMVHPANLDSYAYLTNEQLEDFVHVYPEFEQPAREQAERFADGYLLQKEPAWDSESKAASYLQNYSVWDQGMELSLFLSLQLQRWQQFVASCEKEDVTYIFDCAFLQDHITELMLFYDISEEELITYFKQLEKVVELIHPYIVYLQQPEIAVTLKQAAMERVDGEGRQVWLEGVSGFMEQTLYWKRYGLSGMDGMIAFYQRRKELDLLVLNALSIPYRGITHQDNQWQKDEEEVMEVLNQLLEE